MFKVYDFDGTEKDLDWLRQNYGNVRIVEAAAPGAGAGPAFRLSEIHVSHAEAVLQPQSRNADGTPRAGDHVCNTWPGIALDPAHGVVDLGGDPSLKTVYQRIACVQSTDANGQTGFGLGTGSYIQNLADGGPHSVWIASPTYPSDVICGIGMLGGTNHWGPLRPAFMLMADSGDPGGGGDDGGGGTGGQTVKDLLTAALAQVDGIADKIRGALALLG